VKSPTFKPFSSDRFVFTSNQLRSDIFYQNDKLLQNEQVCMDLKYMKTKTKVTLISFKYADIEVFE